MFKINFGILSDKHVYTIFVGKPWRQNGFKVNPVIYLHQKFFITIIIKKTYVLSIKWKLNKN